ncbi:FAD-dependent oxidoreductase [Actinocatenispora rupis]|uniref:Cholesterol oxidase n=1 Tax=Actinocatenispora rupis TaxID=519421 RepID=A0A8J3IZF9_9ACTN|nr:GMC family oxidoreductase [Actinocatenispora rupis]GID11670.1 cholesterol oxidase [Actinocatenispora rupis]
MGVADPVAAFDVVVIGSGFGGSAAALRLTEKGYRVAVVEAGRRFADDELPETSWRLRRFLWAPRLGCFGIQRITLLRNVLVLSGAGVGGGSLVYANTLYRPPAEFFADRQWADITDWAAELAPYYDQAERMLGVVEYGTDTPSDVAMRTVAERMGVGDTFHRAPVGVFLGMPGRTAPDPYFGGAGPARTGCLECGECMTGCRHNAKNTLVKNYLYLAERAGARVFPLSTVTAVRPAPGGGYRVEMARTGTRGGPRDRRVFAAGQVVFAAGALGTQRLLLRMRDDGVLSGLSPALGTLTRTNSESIVGARSRRSDVDFTRGVAITSSFHPDARTHIEPVRYGRGSNAMSLLQTVLTDGGGRWPRAFTWLAEAARHPGALARSLSTRHWSERTIIALVMQSLDNSLTVRQRRTLFGGHTLTTTQGYGEPNPAWIPAGNEAVRRLAEEIDGDAGGTWGEIANIPITAHILGGCPIADSPDRGVLDGYQRVHGHPGLHVLDGAAVSANLGVNPSLTITAQAERALAYWPNHGDADPRPPLGEPYRQVVAVAPRSPVVPAGAPGALRLPS